MYQTIKQAAPTAVPATQAAVFASDPSSWPAQAPAPPPKPLQRRLTKSRRPNAMPQQEQPPQSQLSATSTATSTSATSASSFSDRSTVSIVSEAAAFNVGESIPPEQKPRFIKTPLKTPTWGETDKGSLSIIASTTIRAPLATVAALVLDARTYPKWNRFTPSLTILEIQRSVAALPRCIRRKDEVIRIANNTTTLREGISFTAEVVMDLAANKSRESPVLMISALEDFERDGRAGFRLAFRVKNRTQGWIMKSERVQEFLPARDDPEGSIEYTVWETFYGLLGPSIKTLAGKSIEEGYTAFIKGLKFTAEGEAQRERAARARAAMPALPQQRRQW